MAVNCPSCRLAFVPQPVLPYTCPHCETAVIGPYCDAQRIGSGAMGDVYRVRRPDLGNRIFALKMPRTNDLAARRRFDRESAATALLQHEAIVRAIDCGQDQGRDFLVMEFVEGILLHELVRREQPLSAYRVTRILSSLSSGLAHAARRGIVNRDVKPENIMVLPDGTAKLLDFGLALIKSVDGAVDRTTQDGVRLGTIAFMAPEQADDPRDITIAADVYALGCTGYFALAGEPPFRGSNQEILRQHAQASRPQLMAIRSDIPPRLASLLAEMMAIEPAERPTPEQIVQQLEEILKQREAEDRHELTKPLAAAFLPTENHAKAVPAVRLDDPTSPSPPPNREAAAKLDIPPAIVSSWASSASTSGHPDSAKAADEEIVLDAHGNIFTGFDEDIILEEVVREEAAGAYSEGVQDESTFTSQPTRLPQLSQPTAIHDANLVEGEILEGELVQAESLGKEIAQGDLIEGEVVDGDIWEPADSAPSLPLNQNASPRLNTSSSVDISLFHDSLADGSRSEIQPDETAPFVGWVGEDGSLDLAIRAEELVEGEILEESDVAAHLNAENPTDAWTTLASGTGIPIDDEPFRGRGTSVASTTSQFGHTAESSSQFSTRDGRQDDTEHRIEFAFARHAQHEAADGDGGVGSSRDSTSTAASRMPSRSARTTGERKMSTGSKGRRRSWVPKLILGSLLLLIAGVGVALYWAVQPPPPDDLWRLAQDDFRIGKFTESEKHFTDFESRYIGDPRTTEIPFFRALIQAAREVDSITGDWNSGLKQLDQLYLDYRDEAVYEKYRADLFKYYDVLITRFIDQVKKKPEQATLALARRALQGLTTVGQSMPDDWVPKKMADMTALVEQEEIAVKQLGTKQSMLALLQLPAEDSLTDYDALYQRVEAMLEDHSELREDRDVLTAITNLRQSEVQRVTYQSASEQLAAAERNASDLNASVTNAGVTNAGVTNASDSNASDSNASDSNASVTNASETSRAETTGTETNADERDTAAEVIYVVWDQATTEDRFVDSSAVQLSLANGVLYAFSSAGQHLWSRRLGVDSDRLPQRIRAAKTMPDLLLAVSTLENSLDAIDLLSGKTIWRYRADSGETLAAPLTICRWKPEPHRPEIIRGLLASTTGDVHVLELVRGQTMGRYRTGVPMTNTGGVFDPSSQLVYMPADSKRFFALDPGVIEGASTTPARSILITDHASGSLRAPPVVVGPYLVTIESADLEHTVVRAFQLNPTVGFEKPDAPAAKEINLGGWAWFTPPIAADRLTVVTDTGELGVLGLNLDNAAEALYPLIESANKGAVPQLEVNLPQRAMAIHSDEHLLWLMAGGSLHKLRLDILKQVVKPVWSSDTLNSPVKGLPLHPANFDLEQQRIYLTTRSVASEQVTFSAVDAEQGETLWQRQLGFYPALDPISLADGSLLLVDRSGRLLRARAEGPVDRQVVEIEPENLPSPDSVVGQPQLIQDEAGGMYLAISLREGRAVGIRTLAPTTGAASPWQILELPEGRLQGRPTVLNQHLVFVAANPGQPAALFRVPLSETATRQADPYRWPQATVLTADDQVQLYAINQDQVLLAVGNAIHWLQWDSSGVVPTWKSQEGWFYARAGLTGPLIQVGKMVYAIDRDHTLYRIRADEPSDAVLWRSSEQITAGPFLWNEQVVVVEGGRSLVAFDTQATSQDLLPKWRHRLLSGRICGRPVRFGNYLLVTDLAGGLTPIDLATGTARPRVPFFPGAIPAAASTLLGHRRILIPMADGTLLWQSLAPTPNRTL